MAKQFPNIEISFKKIYILVHVKSLLFDPITGDSMNPHHQMQPQSNVHCAACNFYTPFLLPS
jgi:hypothetical protein